VAHSCNPSYSGGREQEDLGSKPVWSNRLKKKITKRAVGVSQSVDPAFKPQYQKINKLNK
jgi:hypothetical protein